MHACMCAMAMERCLSHVKAYAMMWLKASTSDAAWQSVVDEIEAEIYDESKLRSSVSGDGENVSTSEFLHVYQHISIAVSLCVFTNILEDSTTLDRIISSSLAESNKLLGRDEDDQDPCEMRLLAIYSMVYGGLPLETALRSESALFCAHGHDARLYAFHAQKLARGHTIAAIMSNSVDPDDAWHHVHNDMASVSDDILLSESLLVCPRCRNRKVSYTERQTRSADEPLTTYATCHVRSCKHKWKF